MFVDDKSVESVASGESATDNLEADDFIKIAAEDPAQEMGKTDAPTNITTDNADQPIVVEEPKAIVPEEEKPIIVEDIQPIIKEEVVAVEDKKPTVQIHKVQSGETLMQIAFKLYGDISRWKELKQMNSEKVSDNGSLKSHTELKYMSPAKKFVWNPEGTAYLIKNGETLGTISNTVYQTPRHWKEIWNNNRPLIKNPNIIYAGFTLYYKGKSDVAMEQIEEEIINIQSATEKTTNEISPFAE
jgi:nucleoid-associated protein YgaU